MMIQPIFTVLLLVFVVGHLQAQQWVRFPEPSGATWNTITVSTTDPTIMVAANSADKMPHYTTNGGTSWQQFPENSSMWSALRYLKIDKGTKQTVLAISDKNIVETTNFGQSWSTRCKLPASYLKSFTQHPNTPGVLFAQDIQDLWRSTNSGETWQKVFSDASYRLGNLAFSPTRKGVVFLLSNNKLFESLDTGATWKQFTHTPPRTNLTLFTFTTDAVADHRMYGVFQGTLALSTDDGRTWSDRSGRNVLSVDGFSQEASNPSVIYAWGTNILRSSDQGMSWNSFDTTHTYRQSVQLVNGTLYTGNYESGIYKSGANNTWTKLDRGINRHDVKNLIRYTDNTWFLHTTNDVYKTNNKGETWEVLTPVKYDQPSGGRVYAFAIAPSDSTRMYGGTNSDIYRSTDGGRTWLGSGYNEPVYSISVHPVQPNEAVTAGLYGVRRTTDGGVTWKSASVSGMHGLELLSRSSVNPRNLLVAEEDDEETELYASTDGGATWAATESLPGRLTCLIADVKSEATFYAIAAQQLYITTNLGASWTPFQGAHNFTVVATDSRNSDMLHAISAQYPGTILRLQISKKTVDTVYATAPYSADNPAAAKHLIIAGNTYVIGTSKGLYWFDPTPTTVGEAPEQSFNVDEPVTLTVYGLQGTVLYTGMIRGLEATQNLSLPSHITDAVLFVVLDNGKGMVKHKVLYNIRNR
ncbi:MAG: glycosyl hydrolase [Chlorobi bacterium OLB6]|nr:MAG: glycosyl hydrolase [Chlorobi bacterium OLB6]